MQTDPARVRRTDPGESREMPGVEPAPGLFGRETKEWVVNGCRTAGIGCLECKQPVIDAINAELKPIRERAAQYEEDPDAGAQHHPGRCEKAPTSPTTPCATCASDGTQL
jgi:tryptophanyl-tRNA synthetase